MLLTLHDFSKGLRIPMAVPSVLAKRPTAEKRRTRFGFPDLVKDGAPLQS